MWRVAILCAVSACGCATESERAAQETITVTVVASGVPVADVPVWFQARDGAALRETRTDANGIAASFADDGASVSVLTSYSVDGNALPELFTIANARAGDRLIVEGVGEDLPARTVHFELPVDPGATSYTIHASCLLEPVTQTSVTIVLAGCDDEEAFVIHSMQGGVLGELYVAPRRVTDGMTIDLRDRAFAAPRRVPIELAAFSGQRDVRVSTALVFERNQVDLPSTVLDLRSGSAAWSGFGGVPVTAVEARMDDGFIDQASSHVLVAWGPALDAARFEGSMLLPRIAGPTLDADTRTFTWTQPTGADFAHFAIQTSATASSVWHVVGPIDGATFTYPLLPATLADWRPMRDDLAITYEGRLIASTIGYDGLRAHYFERLSHPFVAGPHGRTVTRTFAK